MVQYNSFLGGVRMKDSGLELAVVSPVGETRGAIMTPMPRLADLSGKRIALYHNHKTNASVCLDYVQELLTKRVPDVEIYRCGRGQSIGQRFEGVIQEIKEAKVDALVASYGD